ncbi:MAG: arsenosugar biosynthesis radical SAM (seleno)protein ArsS [Planctomycetota bacterium]
MPDELDLSSDAAGPKGTKSLRVRHSPLADPAMQRDVLAALAGPSFGAALREAGWEALAPAAVEIFQINIGKLCNMTCRHCHVDAGPDRVAENMDRDMIDACLRALDQFPSAHTVDITGGAPELNPHFRYLVEQCHRRGKHVIDRCNLTVLLLPRFADLPEFLAAHEVEVVCSLPHVRATATDSQRGRGTYEKSIDALKRLNAAGYGKGDAARVLTLMSNPTGALLPAGQASMEREWKRELQRLHGITFDRLITLTNMPISRFLEWLQESGNLESYMHRLVSAFNPATIPGLMCRNTLSIGWDGQLYDCDFNQMLDLPVSGGNGARPNIRDIDVAALAARRIVVGRHCYGCTAGAGSSCGGSIK